MHVGKGINEEKIKGSGKTLKQNMTFGQILQGLFTTKVREGKLFQEEEYQFLLIVSTSVLCRHFLKGL